MIYASSDFKKLKLVLSDVKTPTILFIALSMTTAGVATTSIDTAGAQQNPVIRYANNLVVDLTLFGLSNNTGQIYAFVNAQGTIQSTVFNATKLDSMDNATDGIGQYIFEIPHVALKPGQPFTTCIVIPSNVKMMCVTDNKSPYPRPQLVDIAIK